MRLIQCPYCDEYIVAKITHDNTPPQPSEEMYYNLERDGLADCPMCRSLFEVVLLLSRGGEVVDILQVEKVAALNKIKPGDGKTLIGVEERLCPSCGRRTVMSITREPLFLPPTGGDYEWVEMEAVARCDKCHGEHRLLAKTDLAGNLINLITE